MRQYKFQHRIRTVSELYDSFEYHGFTFSPWDYDPSAGTCGDAWLVERVHEAETVDDAYQTLRDELLKAVNRIGFVSQCFTWLENEPFLILRLDNNENKTFYFQYAEEHGVTPLMFMNEEKAALDALEFYQERGDVFRFLREAGIAPSFYPRMAMLASALEALAGEEINVRGMRTTKKEYIKAVILKDDPLYDSIFKPNEGIRNRLLHGGRVDLTLEQHAERDHVKEVYQAILRYFHEIHGVEISLDVVGPMRNPIGNYRGWRGWVKPKDESVEIQLFPVHQSFHYGQTREGKAPETSFNKSFTTLLEPPLGY